MNRIKKWLARVWLFFQAWLLAFDCAFTPAVITYATGAAAFAPAAATIIATGGASYLACKIGAAIVQHCRNKKKCHKHKRACSKHHHKKQYSVQVLADMGSGIHYHDVPQPPQQPPEQPQQPGGPPPPPQPEDPECPQRGPQNPPPSPTDVASLAQITAAKEIYEHRESLQNFPGATCTAAQELSLRIVQAAEHARKLCPRHHTIDQAEESLITAFNRSEIAIQHGIRLARNFFTHIRYGDYIQQSGKIVGGHQDQARCCFNFVNQRVLTGGHSERVVKAFFNGQGGETKSIMPDVNPEQILQFIKTYLERGDFIIQKNGYLTFLKPECGIAYIFRLGADNKFDSFFPSVQHLMAKEALVLGKCALDCFK